MIEAAQFESTPLARVTDAMLSSGRPIFALAIIGLGVETLICAQRAIFLYRLPSHPQFKVVPVLPFLPPIPWLAYAFGAVLVLCGIGILFPRTLKPSATVVGNLMFLGAVLLNAPRNAIIPGSMGLRTVVFEPLAIAALAWLSPGPSETPRWLDRTSRYLLALSLIVFGIDHFLALAPIGTLIPGWIPWHVFWIGFFGAGFIAAGLSIATGVLIRWGAACLGLMYAIWVLTLHLPTVLGLYVIPDRQDHPALWSSLFIAIALWGGPWALARSRTRTPSANLPVAPSPKLAGELLR
ncbi:MAG: hypothetical protein WAN10_05435 [Candidatus Acidiferrales bacterium]